MTEQNNLSTLDEVTAEQRELEEYKNRLARRVQDIEKNPDGND